jgi:hypothetical protein
VDYRRQVAYSLMGAFIVLTSVGAIGLFGLSAGLVVGGVASGLVGYLLGAE